MRKQVVDALEHRASDRVPIDFGGTNCSGIHASCVEQLRAYYGLEKRPVKIYEPFQMLALLEEDLKQAMGVDTEPVLGPYTVFGFPNEGWKEYRLDSGQEVLVSRHFNVTKDEKGDTYIYPRGDTTCEPSGHMPYGGYYFDAVERAEEVDDDELTVEDNLEEFTELTAKELAFFTNEIRSAHATGRAVVASFGGTGLGDIAFVPGPALKKPKGIRGIEEWYVSTVTRRDYLHELFERQTDIALRNLKRLNDAAGSLVDAAFVCGTDFGTQTGTFCSPETFKTLYMPYYKKVNGWIHANTPWKTFKHCCGAVESFMELFIEAGFDIINPVQCSAMGMDPKLLKARYGSRLTFWGGGVDTQKTLPFGTKEQVRDEVLRRCEIFSKDGGFVFNAIHNIQAKTPVENIVAMLDAVHEFNGGK